MMIKKRAIGVVNVYTTEPRQFSDAEIKLIQAVANQAAVAIENTKLHEEAIAARNAVETGKIVNRAKAALMKQMGLSEDAAHKLLVKKSRDKYRVFIKMNTAQNKFLNFMPRHVLG